VAESILFVGIPAISRMAKYANATWKIRTTIGLPDSAKRK